MKIWNLMQCVNLVRIEEMTQYYVTYIYIVTYILLYAKEETSKDDNFLWWFSILPKQGEVALSPLHIDSDLIFVQKPEMNWFYGLLLLHKALNNSLWIDHFEICVGLSRSNKNDGLTSAQRWDLAVFCPLFCISTYKQMKPISRSF